VVNKGAVAKKKTLYNLMAKYHYLANLITPSAAATARAGLRSATSGSVAVPRTTSSLGDRSFAVAAPRAWNNLPLPLRRVHAINIFRRQLVFAQAI